MFEDSVYVKSKCKKNGLSNQAYLQPLFHILTAK